MLIMISAAIRQSFISYIYVFIILWNSRAAAEVLSQRLYAQDEKRLEVSADLSSFEDKKREKNREINDINEDIIKQK
jgi:hypothetical protein